MRKDLGIALEEARGNGAHLPLTALVDQFYSAGSAPADYFNEAEEAYVFDMDPATGLSFDLYGSAITKRIGRTKRLGVITPIVTARSP